MKKVRKTRRSDRGGARRLADSQAEPAPTVMAGGIGSVNTSQYTLNEPPCGWNESGRDTVADPGKPAASILGHGRSNRGTLAPVGATVPRPGGGKPPYRVPPMAEVAALPWNGLTVASTFSGCGGSCLGYRMAGFRVAWANEFVPSAQECYRLNAAPGSHLDPRAVQLVKPRDVLHVLGVRPGELDLLDGSPPCQAFSTAGKRHKGWGEERTYEGGHAQRNEDLFAEYLRLLRGLLPRTFVAENVSGLVKGTCKGVFLELLADMRAAGYKVAARVLDAQWLGVPQVRKRVIFVGAREDLGVEPCHPAPLPWRYSVLDALPWLAGDAAQEPLGTVQAGADRRTSSSFSHGTCLVPPGITTVAVEGERSVSGGGPVPTVRGGRAGHLVTTVTQQQGAPGVGKKPVDLADSLPTVCGTQAQQFILDHVELESKLFSMVRPKSSDPCPTVTGGGGQGKASVCHPTERRKFTIAELRRLCAFPDDFQLVGSYAQQWERLGNSVPPAMMFWVARTLRDRVLFAVGGRGPWERDPPCLVEGTEWAR